MREASEKDNEIYSSYGKFAIQFENLCQRLRECILFYLESSGLKEQFLTHIMITDLSAYQLISKNRAIISFLYRENPKIIHHLEPFFTGLLSLNEQRNFIIHGDWKITGHYDNDGNSLYEPGIIRGRKGKITKDGVKFENVKYSKNEFDKLSEKLIMAQKITHMIYGFRDADSYNESLRQHIEDYEDLSLLTIIRKEDIDFIIEK